MDCSGAQQEDVKEKKGKRLQMKRKAAWNSVFQRRGGERIEIKGNAQLVLNVWTPFSDNTLCCSTKFSDQLYVYPGPCSQQDLGLWILQKYRKVNLKKLMESGTKSLKMERNGEG